MSKALQNKVKLNNIISIKEYGAVGDGVVDDTATIQSALTAASGKKCLFPPGTYKITSTLNVAGNNSEIVLETGATIDYSTVASYQAMNITGSGCTLTGGEFLGASAWDGTNTSPSYGVIKIAGNKCTISTKLTNVRKVGLWFKDVTDGTATHCFIEGNYPSGSWTGVETGHWGIIFDPTNDATVGNFKVVNSTIKSCVQGCQSGNYGLGGVVRGFVATGNIFEGCWNHGIYSNFTNGASISGNTFNRCQIPVVISGDYNTVTGNSMYTAESVIGDERDITGISVRDGSFNVISNNTIRGVAEPPGNVVCINVQDVSGASDLIGNVVSGNTIDIVDGTCVAIRVTTSSKISQGNIVANNVIRAKGQANEGLIGIYGQNGKVGGNITGVTKANPGIITTTSAHGLAVNDMVVLVDFQGMTQINGTYLVNSTPTTTTLSVKTISGTPVDTTAYGAWTSGGEVRKQSLEHWGNRVVGNNIIIKNECLGVYGICQKGLSVLGNTIEFDYNAPSPVNLIGIGVFDSYNVSVSSNAYIVKPSRGQNFDVLGFREYSGTLTQQLFNNMVSNQINQVKSAYTTIFQSVESLSGSGLIADVEGTSTPSLPCAPGSTWKKTNGTFNDVFYVKQNALDNTGWEPMSVVPQQVAAASIAAIANAINTTGKYTGKQVWDTTNNRMMYALGSAAASGWRVVDGSTTVTPA